MVSEDSISSSCSQCSCARGLSATCAGAAPNIFATIEGIACAVEPAATAPLAWLVPPVLTFASMFMVLPSVLVLG